MRVVQLRRTWPRFRTTPRFDVASDSVHGWLGRTVFLCTAGRYSDHVRLDIFAIS